MNDSRERFAWLRQWILAHPILAFPLVYLGWAYLFWTPLLLSKSSVWAFPNLLWFLIGGTSPLVAGLSLAALTGGKAHLRDLAGRLRANAEALKHPVLLDVIVGRLETWTASGLLLLGDAAHPMSPNGGQGINMALRDALVAANHLCPVLTRGNDAAARRIAAERMPEIVAIQEHQRKQTQTFLRSDRLSSRLAMRLLPLLAESGLVRLLLEKRLRALQHGVVPVRLTV